MYCLPNVGVGGMSSLKDVLKWVFEPYEAITNKFLQHIAAFKFSQDYAEDGFRSLINNQKIIVVKTKDKLIWILNQ